MINVKLERQPTPRDYQFVSLTAEKPCECTEEMVANKELDDDMCKPCAARQVLNGITSLAEKL